VVVILLKKKQLLLCGEGRFDKLDDIGEGEVDCDVEVAEPQEISVFGDGDFAVVDALDQFEDLLLFLISFELGQHVFGNEAVHLSGAEIVEQVDGGL
jgi:hypothetical protein